MTRDQFAIITVKGLGKIITKQECFELRFEDLTWRYLLAWHTFRGLRLRQMVSWFQPPFRCEEIY